MNEQDKYRRIAAALREGIKAGLHPVGTMLPSRHALVEQYGVSHITARHAITVLESEGLVRVEQGRGVTVISDRIERTTYQMRQDNLMAELLLLADEVHKYFQMATRDGYLHPATIDGLPHTVFRVMLEAGRLWDERNVDAA